MKHDILTPCTWLIVRITSYLLENSLAQKDVCQNTAYVTGTAVTWSESFWNMPCSEANINNKSLNQGWKMCQVTMYKNHFSLTSLLYFWKVHPYSWGPDCPAVVSLSVSASQVLELQTSNNMPLWLGSDSDTFPRLWRMFSEDTIAWLWWCDLVFHPWDDICPNRSDSVLKVWMSDRCQEINANKP